MQSFSAEELCNPGGSNGPLRGSESSIDCQYVYMTLKKVKLLA